ncbi:MAG: hypothetical protein RL023_982 [Candidatus Parcubacteria bacterium]
MIKTSNEHSSNIVLLAKDSTGYHNLLQLVSHANLEGRHGKARIDLSLLKTYATGLYCLI